MRKAMLVVPTAAAAFFSPSPFPAQQQLAAARSPAVTMKDMQASQIAVGDTLPLVDFNSGVQIVTDDCSFDDSCEIIESQLNEGKTVLIGMPGAFTPTCTDEHLPGFIRAAKQFRRAGVKRLAVVTTNDVFIMTAWKRKMRECASAEGIGSLDGLVDFVADKEGHLIRALGMADYQKLDRKESNAFIQFNTGVRSKRFAVVMDDGVVQHVAVDNGTIELDVTSADATLAALKGTVPGTVGDAVDASVADVAEAPAVPLVLTAIAALVIAYVASDAGTDLHLPGMEELNDGAPRAGTLFGIQKAASPASGVFNLMSSLKMPF